MFRILDELSDFEKLALIDISYSRLDTYDMCPAKYFYTYIQQEPRVFGAAATLGNVVHSVLEEAVGEELDAADMIMMFDQYREQFDPEHEITEELIDTGIQLVHEYVARHGKDELDLIGKEFPIKLVIGQALITGYIDRVERDPDGTIRITDYKTGKWEYKGPPKENLQLGIYACAAAYYFPDTPIYAELYYLRSGRKRGALFGVDELATAAEMVKQKVDTILEDRNFQWKPGFQCSFCDFAKKKGGVCKNG